MNQSSNPDKNDSPRAGRVHLSYLFVLLWPYIHWSIAIGFTIVAVEALYFLAPNVKQRFLATLPGAILAVGVWLVPRICWASTFAISQTLTKPTERWAPGLL
jgi:uncharacterized BrkB/YihY/UPF0761 family membrane protein